MTNDRISAQPERQTPPASPSLRDLAILVGTWDVELRFPVDPPGVVQTQAVFEWLEDEGFVIERLSGSRWIMGLDDTNETYYTLYHDERGVSRMYEMRLSDGVWRLWRSAPGFSQRFEGRFDDDDKTITAYWEKSTDGSTWERDFDLTYKKVRPA